MREIKQPIHRGSLRRILGKEGYILKRKLDWIKSHKTWASQRPDSFDGTVVKHHQSMILRPLKDVDMYVQENKRTNLRLAIESIDGVVIRPGEVFSIWKMVGRPTASKGYLEGLVLSQGKITSGIGGGLCQLGNLLFWIIAHSKLSIIERHRHGYDVFPDVNRKVPFGAGATLAYNYIDFQVANRTADDYQLNLWMDETHLHGELLVDGDPKTSIRIEERGHIMKQQLWGAYSRHNQIFQVEYDGPELIREKLIVENHAIMMYNPFLQP